MIDLSALVSFFLFMVRVTTFSIVVGVFVVYLMVVEKSLPSISSRSSSLDPSSGDSDQCKSSLPLLLEQVNRNRAYDKEGEEQKMFESKRPNSTNQRTSDPVSLPATSQLPALTLQGIQGYHCCIYHTLPEGVFAHGLVRRKNPKPEPTVFLPLIKVVKAGESGIYINEWVCGKCGAVVPDLQPTYLSRSYYNIP